MNEEVPVHTIKAYRGSGDVAPVILKLVTGWSNLLDALTVQTPGKNQGTH